MSQSTSRPTVADGPFTGRSLAQLGAGLRDGRFTPIDLAEQAVAAIARWQPVINAFVTVDDTAVEQAQRLGDELAAGHDRGPLHGIPVAVKDLIDTVGLSTTMGSRHFAGNRPDRDAAVVARLRTAGAIVIGKTTTHEFGYGPTGDVSANGACANPRDPRLMSGGSSAGSAAAVAAGLVPLALGTDTGGSVRIPAALCEVAGLRPGPDRLDTRGVFPLSWSMDELGPIAASIADLRLAWSVLTGETPPDGARIAAGLTVGVATGDWWSRCHPRISASLATLADRLAAAGARVEPVAFEDGADLAECYRIVQSAEAVAVHRDRIDRAGHLFQPEVLARLRAAEQVPAWRYAEVRHEIPALRAAAAQRLAGVDVVMLATVPIEAPPLGERAAPPGGDWPSVRDALLAFTAPTSVLGLPSVSLPGPAGPGGRPGVQLLGWPGGEAALLAAAALVEACAAHGG